MISRNGIFWTGVLVIVVPFLGLPTSWKTLIFVLIGLWLCIMAFSPSGKKPRASSGRSGGHKKEHSSGAAFSENRPKISPVSTSAPAAEPPTTNHEESQRV